MRPQYPPEPLPCQAERVSQGTSSKAPLDASWGAFLALFPWEWFVTLTFRGPIGEWGAERKFKRLVYRIRQDCGHRSEWFRVTEWHKFRRVPHYHALMLDLAGARRRMRYVDWWWGQGYGTARVLKYNKRLGAGQYLGKYLVKAESDVSVSPGLKRLAARLLGGSTRDIPDAISGRSTMPA